MSTMDDLAPPQPSRPRARRRLAGALAALTLISTVGVAVGAQPALAATTYYVDGVNGVDSFSGTAAVPGSGGVGPFKTIQKCADEAGPGDVCSIRGGTYRERVVPNSGTDGAPVTFRAHNDEPVTVTGLNRVTSAWTQHSGNIYKTTVTLPIDGYADSGFLANQLFVGGAPLVEARSPNTGRDLLRDQTRASADLNSDPDTLVDAELPQIAGGWTGGRVYFRTSKKYTSSSARITSATSTRLELDTSTLNTDALSCQHACMGEGALYYLYGKLGALDTANEWFYDAPTRTLYAWAPGGGTPSNIEFKARTDAFNLKGKSDVNVVGLRLTAATVSTDATSARNVLDRLDVSHVSHFMTVPFNPARTFGGIYDDAHMRDTGIILHGTSNTLKNSIVAYSAGNGVSVGGSGHVVDNNVIHDVNYGGTYSAGVVSLGGSTNVKITRNTIYNTGRDGINVSVNRNMDPQTWKNNEVAYNEIFDVGLLNNDLGAIYLCCSIDMTGTRIHRNLIHNRTKNSVTRMGIYLDGGSGNAVVHHNTIQDSNIFLNTTNTEQGGGVNHGNVSVYNNWTDSLYFASWYTHATNGIKNNIFRAWSPPTGAQSHNISHGTDVREQDQLSFDYRLRPASPAINAGTPVPGITDGYVGSAPDIGPYEVGQEWRAGATFFTASENLARSSVVTASSSATQHPVAALNDGERITRWAATGTSNQWVQFDLGAPVPVNRIAVNVEYSQAAAWGRVTSWAAQQWNGSAWVDLKTGIDLHSRENNQENLHKDVLTINFPTVTTSRIRLLMMTATASPSIKEMAVYRAERITNPLPDSGIGVPKNYRLGTTNLCLDVYGATSAPLSGTVAWGCHGNANQKWTRTAAGELRVYGSNCLDVYGGVTAAGSRVVIYPCHGYDNQRWTLRADGTLLNARSGRCAATRDGSTAQGVEIVLADCSTAANQRWTAY